MKNLQTKQLISEIESIWWSFSPWNRTAIVAAATAFIVVLFMTQLTIQPQHPSFSKSPFSSIDVSSMSMVYIPTFNDVEPELCVDVPVDVITTNVDVKLPVSKSTPKKVKEKVTLPSGDIDNYGSSNDELARMAYVERFINLAYTESNKFNIPVSIILAQGILESNAGRSRLALRANNHFGIKSQGKHWPENLKKLMNGKLPVHDDCCKTKSCSNPDKFVSFESAWASYRAHSVLFTKKRYRHLLELDRTNYKEWAHGLKKAGYATDPRYAENLIRLIEKYDLHLFDRHNPKKSKK